MNLETVEILIPNFLSEDLRSLLDTCFACGAPVKRL